MEQHSLEDEKFTKLRQTIRSVILPLVQAIYSEDPTDVISFCFGYFDGLLRHRGTEINTDNLNSKYTGATSDKNEASAINGTSETMNVAPNVQGSASEPILTSDKHSENVSVRETSSWNLPSNHSRSDGSFSGCNVADILSRIGDQPGSKVENEETLQCDIKTGDANFSQKVEENGLRDDIDIENDTAVEIMHGPTQESQNTCVFPLSNEKKSNSVHGDLSCRNVNQTTVHEGKTKEAPENLKPDASFCSTTAQNIPVKGNNKQLSPNSSFGFVPHLTLPEDNLKKETEQTKLRKLVNYNEINNIRENDEEMEELTKKLSETLQSLAQEFSSAETNFNETFQNVKEISDVVQGQHGTTFTQDSDKDNEVSKRDLPQVRNENNHFLRNESKCKKSPENFLKKPSDLKTTDDSRNINFQELRYSTDYEAGKESSNFAVSEVQNSKQQQPNKEQSDSTLPQEVRKDSGRPDNAESRQILDESWKRRWYEAHPHLDIGCPQANPRFFRGPHFNSNRPIEPIPNIGEAGDVPYGRFYAADRDPNGNLARSLESSHVSRPPATMGENNAYSSFSADEIRRRNVGRMNRNYPDREHISSQNIPYSWRQMPRPQARSSESEEKRSKQSQIKDGKVSENDNKRDLNENAHAAEPEVLSEVIVVKGTEGKAKRDSLNGTQNASSSKTDENKEYTEVYHLAKNYWDIIEDENRPRCSFYQQESATGDHPDDGGDEEPLKPQQATNDDSCSKNCMEMANGSCSLKSKEESELQQNESSEKVEPGLVSAGGDFVVNDEDREENGEESNATARDQNQSPSGEITAEYFEEIIGRVMEQQEVYKDTLECLNFSSYSESDKSSDYSETDEYGLNSSV